MSANENILDSLSSPFSGCVNFLQSGASGKGSPSDGNVEMDKNSTEADDSGKSKWTAEVSFGGAGAKIADASATGGSATAVGVGIDVKAFGASFTLATISFTGFSLSLTGLESSVSVSATRAAAALDSTLVRPKAVPDVTDAAYVIRDVVLQKMAELRVVCDEAETLTAAEYWPFPTYGDLLFGVR